MAAEYAALLVQAEWRSFILRRRKIVEIFQGPERKLLVRMCMHHKDMHMYMCRHGRAHVHVMPWCTCDAMDAHMYM